MTDFNPVAGFALPSGDQTSTTRRFVRLLFLTFAVFHWHAAVSKAKQSN